MTDIRKRTDRDRVKPGSILRAAGAGGKADMPNFADEGPPRARTASQTRLAVERKDGRVAKIIAYCRCGEKIVIDCDYPAAGEDTPEENS